MKQIVKVIYVLLLGVLVFFSCGGIKDNKEKLQATQNQLIITSEGDSVENGFWSYNKDINSLSQKGTYEDGYKIDKWTYIVNGDSVNTRWSIINYKGVTFNFPDYFKRIHNTKPPVLFQADIEDNDDNTYLVLLRYDLTEIKSSVYDYLYQYNDSWKNNNEETLKSKEFKKFYFKNIEIFQAKVQTKREINYEAVSYCFVVNNFLYDLTYKNAVSKNSAIGLEIFNDILYSMKCENVDLFDYNSRKYLKEENIEFKRSSSLN